VAAAYHQLARNMLTELDALAETKVPVPVIQVSDD
jgi:hypothetical protein